MSLTSCHPPNRPVVGTATVFFERFQNTKACAICMENFKGDARVFVTDCFHTFHVACIQTWATRSTRNGSYPCPACRTAVHVPTPALEVVHAHADAQQLYFDQAVHDGDAVTVQRLLTDGRVNPAAMDNDAIISAAESGFTPVVQLLLADGRADPAARNNDAIIGAAVRGHTQVVQLLLADGRADPSARSNAAIICATDFGHAQVVQLLLTDGRADPSARNNAAIRSAAEEGFTEVVQLLLADGRADPSANDNAASTWAEDNGHDEVLRLLRSAIAARQ